MSSRQRLTFEDIKVLIASNQDFYEEIIQYNAEPSDAKPFVVTAPKPVTYNFNKPVQGQKKARQKPTNLTKPKKRK